ncbi:MULTISPECIES: hypothetical protein [Cupriavidus]|uniref:hypothetical protein n=1 Tax=Cupriavidus sp. DF5525 TaxID=3160989 RepID=UPI0032DF5ED1
MLDGFSNKGNLHAIYQCHPMKETVAYKDVIACVLIERGLSPRTAGAPNMWPRTEAPLAKLIRAPQLLRWRPDARMSAIEKNASLMLDEHDRPRSQANNFMMMKLLVRHGSFTAVACQTLSLRGAAQIYLPGDDRDEGADADGAGHKRKYRSIKIAPGGSR